MADILTSEVAATFKLTGSFEKNMYGDDDIEGDVDNCKWRKFKLFRWLLLLNRSVDLDEISYEGDDIENDLNSILLNPVASAFS
jgi:hypothetical protein